MGNMGKASSERNIRSASKQGLKGKGGGGGAQRGQIESQTGGLEKKGKQKRRLSWKVFISGVWQGEAHDQRRINGGGDREVSKISESIIKSTRDTKNEKEFLEEFGRVQDTAPQYGEGPG